MLGEHELWRHRRRCHKALSLSPPRPSLLHLTSPSCHEDEDYWVRKLLSGLTKHYGFKLRSKRKIFLVSLLS